MNIKPLLEYLNDSEGNKSSKRLFGAMLVICPCLIYTFSNVFAIFFQIVDIEALKIGCDSMQISGTSLLGVGIIEKFAHKDKK